MKKVKLHSSIFFLLNLAFGLFIFFSFSQCKTSNKAVSNETNICNETVPNESAVELDYSKSSLIIHYDAVIGSEELLKSIEEYGAKVSYKYDIINAIAIRLPENKSLENAEQYFKKVKGVMQVSRDYIHELN